MIIEDEEDDEYLPKNGILGIVYISWFILDKNRIDKYNWELDDFINGFPKLEKEKACYFFMPDLNGDFIYCLIFKVHNRIGHVVENIAAIYKIPNKKYK